MRFLKGVALLLLILLILSGLWFWTGSYDSVSQVKTVLDRRGEVIGTVKADFAGRQIWTDLSDIPPQVVNAFLTQEDRHFYRHFGLNPWAMLKALAHNLKNGASIRGGSTITQQLAKNLIQRKQEKLLQRSYLNKFKTTILALGLELKHNKSWILENYLNTAYFGNRCYGIQAAARLYFDKNLSDLTETETQTLVSLPRAPSRFSKTLSLKGEVFFSQNPAPHYLNFIAQKKTSGHLVRTTLDLRLQKELDQSLKAILAERSRRDPQVTAAAVVIAVDSSDVVAMIGSRDFENTLIDGQVNAALSLRQPGSTLKPFTYFAAFAKGLSPDTLVEDMPMNFSVASADDTYMPQNFDRNFHGEVTIREALANSYNVPAVSVLNKVGLSFYHEVLRGFGFTTFTQSPQHYGLAVTLGSGEVNLLELTNAYAALARQGVYKPYRALAEDPATDGKSILDHADDYASQITKILSDPEARLKTFGFHASLSLDGYRVAVKTGTSYELRDNWTLGYSPQYAIGVWVGHVDSSSLRDTTGASGAAPIWHALMEKTLRGQSIKMARSRPYQTKQVTPRAVLEQDLKSWFIQKPVSGQRFRLSLGLPREHQSILAEVNLETSPATKLFWYLDDALLQKNKILKDSKKLQVWLDPVVGEHTLKVRDETGQSHSVTFHVLEN